MYDFWYSLGVAVIDPDQGKGLLNAINTAAPPPDFTFEQRVTVDIDSNGNPTARPASVNTGLLTEGPTTSVRSAIAAYVQRFSKAAYGVNAPPIGIYCAGRF